MISSSLFLEEFFFIYWLVLVVLLYRLFFFFLFFFCKVRPCIYYIVFPTYILYILLFIMFLWLTCIERPIVPDIFLIHLLMVECWINGMHVCVCVYMYVRFREIYFCRIQWHMFVVNNSCCSCQISGNMDRGPLKNCAPETSERNWKTVRKRKVEPVRGVCQKQWHSKFHSTNNNCRIMCRNSLLHDLPLHRHSCASAVRVCVFGTGWCHYYLVFNYIWA